MKKDLLNLVGEGMRNALRQLVSLPFLFMLLGAFVLWYGSELRKDYTTEMPLNMRIDGQKYRIEAEIFGRGSVILAQRLSLRRKLNFTLDELSASMRPSREKEGALTINPGALLRILNTKIEELKVVSIVDAPEFVPRPAEKEEEASAETKPKE